MCHVLPTMPSKVIDMENFISHARQTAVRDANPLLVNAFKEEVNPALSANVIDQGRPRAIRHKVYGTRNVQVTVPATCQYRNQSEEQSHEDERVTERHEVFLPVIDDSDSDSDSDSDTSAQNIACSFSGVPESVATKKTIDFAIPADAEGESSTGGIEPGPIYGQEDDMGHYEDINASNIALNVKVNSFH